MDLHILRHAVAAAAKSDHPGQDSVRELTPEGARKMHRIAEAMKAGGLEFDLILSSPYVRAKQTADIVATVFKLKKVLRLSAALAPHAMLEKFVEEIKTRYPERTSILLVGHEPHLSRLISVLASGTPGMTISLKKGGLAKLTVAGLRAGRCASLDWLLTPKQIRAMG